ncbi:MAG: glycosyltransferase family 9 protein [Candidatus Eremiobacter antarcticus]|nr:glycosyltransferase family 9 protein [Candidatus Eremiobacteraeota bacterium]MBC5808226.1 glycosyltransferase family 9 protein [Candidatus Eremiobacteraeota bacterium]
MSGPAILAACTGGGVGDLLAAMPAVQALSRHFQTRLTVLTTPYAAPLIAGQPSVAEVISDDGGTPVAGLSDRLQARRFTHGVVFWSNARAAAALQRAGIPERVGQARRLYSFRYTKHVTVRSELGDTDSHWTDIQMDYARALGAQPQPDDFRVRIEPHPEDQQQADELIRCTAAGPYVVLHAVRGISTQAAGWPRATFARLADALADEFSLPVVLSGSQADRAIVSDIVSHMRTQGYNAAGLTTLLGFAALSAGARAVVALDSGPMHIAAAAGAPTVGIFALRTDHPRRWRPLGPRVAVVGPSYPCPRFCRKETCRTFACYGALPVEAIVATARSLSDAAAIPAAQAT